MNNLTLRTIFKKRSIRTIALFFGSLFAGVSFASAQNVPCPTNIDFENGDLSGWQCYIGSATGGGSAPNFTSSTATAPIPGRHTILSYPTSGNIDFYGGFPVTPASGGTYSLKLGDSIYGGNAERVRYYVHVPVGFNDYSLNYRFAMVLQNPNGHPDDVKPAFEISAYDSATGNPIPCAQQRYIANSALLGLGFRVSPESQPYDTTLYLPWTGAALPLIGTGGTTVIVEVTSYDCGYGGHFGYGYFDVASCGKYKAAVAYCNLDSGFVRFIGTGITQTYNWYDQNWTYIGQGAYIDAPLPATPTFYYGVLANGVPGCLDTIRTDTVSNFTINATPAATCARFGNPIQLNTTVTGGLGTFTYSWNSNADLSSLNIANPVASPRDTTTYTVTVSDKIGCFRQDYVQITQAPDAGPDLNVCPLGERPVQLFVAGPEEAQFTWTALDGSPAEYLDCTDCRRPVSAPLVPSYTYVVGYAGCDLLDTITVTHDLSNGIDAPQDPLIVCRPSYQPLNAISIGAPPRQNLPCGIANPITCTPADQLTATIGYSNTIPSAKPLNTPFLSEKTYHKYQFIIPKNEMLYYGIYSGTLNSIAFQTLGNAITGNAVENMTISLACVPYTEFPTPVTNNTFQAGVIPVATVSSYTLTPNAWNAITFDAPYSWDTTQNLLVDICVGPIFNKSTPGNGMDGVAMVPGSTIQKSDNFINVCGGNALQVYNYSQRPVVQFQYCQSDSLSFTYTWNPGTYLSDSTSQNPTAYIARDINYSVTTKGRNGCLVVDTLHVIVPQHNLSVTPGKDSSVCQRQPAFLNATGGDAYKWFQYSEGVYSDASGTLSCTDCQSPVATPMQTTTYAVVFSNDIGRSNPDNQPTAAVGCPDTLFTTIVVKPLPPVRIANQDTTIGYGKTVQLFARGASNYTWTPVGTLNDPNSPAPVASPLATTNYIVAGLDSNGCIFRDTVKVTVIFADNLLVPTAFTPNGDSRNDVFRIVNPTYQRLMEFRVFNRWGQEIFTTTDINSGWDGTWKGVPQETGNYAYIIRIGSPDGKVELYKGEVTLVR